MSQKADNISIDALIRGSAIRKADLAGSMGMSKNQFLNKVHGWSEFSEPELVELSRLIGVNYRLVKSGKPKRRE